MSPIQDKVTNHHHLWIWMKQTILEIIAREARLVNPRVFSFNCSQMRWQYWQDQLYLCDIKSKKSSTVIWYHHQHYRDNHYNIIITMSHCNHNFDQHCDHHCNQHCDQHEAFAGGTIGKQVCLLLLLNQLWRWQQKSNQWRQKCRSRWSCKHQVLQNKQKFQRRNRWSLTPPAQATTMGWQQSCGSGWSCEHCNIRKIF